MVREIEVLAGTRLDEGGMRLLPPELRDIAADLLAAADALAGIQVYAGDGWSVEDQAEVMRAVVGLVSGWLDEAIVRLSGCCRTEEREV